MDESVDYDLLCDRFPSDAKENGIIFVTSAGNDGVRGGSRNLGLGDLLPQDRGARDNEIITVGAIYQDGTLWEGRCPRGVAGFRARFVQDPSSPLPLAPQRSKLGWIDMYAPGAQVEVPGTRDGTTELATGTNVSAALVVSTTCPCFHSDKILTTSFFSKAGLVAHFLALPESADRFAWSVDKNNAMPWGVRMKQYRTTLSYQWDDSPNGGIRHNMPSLPFEVPDEINVAYNGAFGPMNTE